MMICVFVETCADGCTVCLSRRTLDLIENQLASKRSFSAETVRSCVADLVRATSPPCGRRLVSRNFISKNLRFTQADSRCIIIALYGSSQNRVANPISQPVVLAHLPGQGHGAPLCVLAAQGMYTGFGYSIFKVHESSFHLSIGHFSGFFKRFLPAGENNLSHRRTKTHDCPSPIDTFSVI